MLKEFCDVCGKEIKDYESNFHTKYLRIPDETSTIGPRGDFRVKEIATCEECAKAIDEAEKEFLPLIVRMKIAFYQSIIATLRRENNDTEN